MSKILRPRTLAPRLLGLIALAAIGTLVPAQDLKRSELMRKKVEFTQDMLQSLTLGDLPRIPDKARALRRVSEAAEWEVPTIPDVEQYGAFTTEFQRLCSELIQTSRDGNLDGATLAYTRLIVSCVHCHKYVRDNRK